MSDETPDVYEMDIAIRRINDPPCAEPWIETYTRYVGQANKVRGLPMQPEFTGDAEQFGKDIVEWFNATEPNKSRHREFVSVVSCRRLPRKRPIGQ